MTSWEQEGERKKGEKKACGKKKRKQFSGSF